MMLYKIVTHLTRRLSHLLALKKQAAIWRRRDTWRGTEGSLQQECEALSSAVYKELKAANNHISSRSFPR